MPDAETLRRALDWMMKRASTLMANLFEIQANSTHPAPSSESEGSKPQKPHNALENPKNDEKAPFCRTISSHSFPITTWYRRFAGLNDPRPS